MDDEWAVIVAPTSLDAWKSEMSDWRKVNDPGAFLGDDDLRVDIIRTTDGDRVRVMARRETLTRLLNLDS